MSLRLGLTGSIGMGKSTTAGFFREFGVPVWDADAEVHALYEAGGAAVQPIGALVPGATTQGIVDREVLKAKIAKQPALLGNLQEIVRPLLRQSRISFDQKHNAQPVAVYDIPLLFETDTESWMNYVLVVTAPDFVQRQRLLARDSMSEAMLHTILSRQMPDAEKRALGDFVFDTSKGLDHTRAEVKALIKTLEQENA